MTKSRDNSRLIQNTAIIIPSGTTGQRPAGSNGYFRFNTTIGSFEGFAAGAINTGGGGGGNSNPNAGQGGGSGIILVAYLGAQRATGGTVSSINGYTIHTFTSSGTFVT